MADPTRPEGVTAVHDGHDDPPRLPGLDADSAGGGIDVLPFLALVLLLGAAVLYFVALRRTRDRSPWPRPRTAA
ncbi:MULTISPECIES: hypothetical protein [Microbacterium]|uniref:hypothetical protein n=1 Tax=Microbacterium TaxID=33882 RepID=UPI0026EA367C|nr:MULTISPECIES: hypothetical protein [Microbacterium]